MTLNPLRIDDFRHRIKWQDVENSQNLVNLLTCCCVTEDMGENLSDNSWKLDITTSLCNLRGSGEAALITREDIIICGTKLPIFLLKAFGCKDVEYKSFKNDGETCLKGEKVGLLKGSISQILAVERTLLNFMQRLSGIATMTSQFVSVLKPYKVGLLDTRKTTPGHRIFEKYATACGGSYNHRMGLFDRILIKDNHLAAAGIRDTRSFVTFLLRIKEKADGKLVEVEIDNLTMLEAAIEAKVDAVLLDNFTPEEVATAVNLNNNQVVLEASGGINKKNLAAYASAKPHFISTGSPVHTVNWVDLGLDWILG